MILDAFETELDLERVTDIAILLPLCDSIWPPAGTSYIPGQDV